MSWSKILHTDLGMLAQHEILRNSYKDTDLTNAKLHYHNINHIYEMYKYLEETQEPYATSLDWAVLFHDIIYDEFPDKELRSAEKLSEMWRKSDNKDLSISELDDACNLIAHTKDHIVRFTRPSSAIIRADLHALTDPVKVFRNFGLIMNESIELYGISELEFCKANEDFMVPLHGRMEHNKRLDSGHANFYEEVQNGIISTITFSKIIRGII